MALNTAQQASLLFKSLQGKSSVSTAKDFFEEPFNGRPVVLPTQIWAEADKIPTTAPALSNLATLGVVKRYVDLALTAVPGVSNAFSSTSLVNCIPFNFGDGTYNYAVKDALGNAIAFGLGDWLVDPNTGVLTFYGTTPGNMPPTISFYQYVGKVGVGSGNFLDETSIAVPGMSGTFNMTGCIFDSTKVKTAFIDYQIQKMYGAVPAGCNESGMMMAVHDPTAGWVLSVTDSVRPNNGGPKIVFSILSSGQVRAGSLESVDGSGNDGTAKISYIVTRSFAP